MTNKTKIQRIRENDMAGRIDLSLVSKYVETQTENLSHLPPGWRYNKTLACLNVAKDRLAEVDTLAQAIIEDETRHRRWL
ncbi:hypothetical protein CO054_02835 [Candidatus Shapirobacteria bacterium CG_4_9_14_0_2_um_filter_39_11]|uniref:Uncharacterized protein n=1 Tax=Candidatus Shapirobacteria bacterium CG_4_9_14_0_2_um_filter_39_11 TaxID=1974478 RepID=A0A2M8ES95_9BACT|nr:MAG: hypothetical protein CO054_02835 [Candidatus Shapirobacteria bacterium CG_4_9_14_0_2_um_filter_39_11]